ncbi:MAG: hypothetical protein LCH82_07860 [Actinobacteria bacterium]|nr:hypothetical protein [Actinomycetota bacterium]
MTDTRHLAAAAQTPTTGVRNGQQNRASFYLTGHRMGTGLGDVDGLGLRSAHFAAYGDLDRLRYDYPLVLTDDRDATNALQSLSGLVDALLAEMGDAPDSDRIRHHAMALETEIRARSGHGPQRLADVWAAAATSLVAAGGDEHLADSLARLTAALRIDGQLVACTADSSRQVVGHLWRLVQQERTDRLAARIERLRQQLGDILAAEQANSVAGLRPDRLAQSLGPVVGAELDADALSRLLTGNRPATLLSDARRERVQRLLGVLDAQRFVPDEDDIDGDGDLFEFVYTDPVAAVTAYQERFAATAELAKALVVAEMEADGRYREEVHDALFAKWDVEDLESDILDLFPKYLVEIDAEAMTAEQSVVLLDALAAGIPVKVLVQVNDLLRGTSSKERSPGGGVPARKLGRYVLAAGEAFVLQTASAGLFHVRERIVAGSRLPGAALFVVYSGGGQWLGALPPYLASAAATEARVFPAFCYDPSAGETWADRLSLGCNPQTDLDWPVHRVSYADQQLQRVTLELPFTAADFWAGDARMQPHLAIAGPDRSEGTIAPFAEHFASNPGIWTDELPYVLMVDRDDRLSRVFVDRPLVHRAQRDVEQWRRLQELGGVHNSHVARELARQRALFEAELDAAREAPAPAPAPGPVATTTPPTGEPGEPGAPDPDDHEPVARDPYLPWIETLRCSTCNECTLINDRMFAYNENRQAFIADPDAGTYAELVQAAENCQVAIIHPAKPRNPAEAGLEELVKRAEQFA